MAIEQTSINMSGKWALAAPLDMTKLQAEIAAFVADSTMALARKEQKKIDLKCPVYIYDATAVEAGSATVVSTLPANYETTLSQIENSMSSTIALIGGTGATAVRAADEEKWTVSFNCQKGSDTFQLIFHKDNLIVQNYSDSATVTALETYFATRPNLAQASA